MNITEPLRLARGSHEKGSGRGCAMNVISWENGDTEITDLPACADPMLARIIQYRNDQHCPDTRRGLLCPSCSVEVLALAHRTVGTSSHGLGVPELEEVWTQVAADQVVQVANGIPFYVHVASSDLADLKSGHLGNAEWLTAHIHLFAAWAAPERAMELAHRAIDVFCELTGVQPSPVAPDVTATAIENMRTVAQ